MLKKLFYVCIILTFCLAPLTGCDPQSTTPKTTPTAVAPDKPLHLDFGSKRCKTVVDSAADEAGNQDFALTITCDGKDLFAIDIDGAHETGGADGVNVDILENDFLNWGTKK